MNSFPEHNENVLCVVDRILGTTVFVRLEEYHKEGVISTSEVAPGRIRNIRDYVIPGKRIVCQVLRVDEHTGHIDLSLRRVSNKDRSEVLSRYEREKNALAMIKVVAKENTESIVSSILKQTRYLSEFLAAPEKNQLLAAGLSAEEAEKLLKIIQEKPEKKISVREKISLSSDAGDGITKIREILLAVMKHVPGTAITYISSPQFFVEITSVDYKEANKGMQSAKKFIVEQAKLKGCRADVPE